LESPGGDGFEWRVSLREAFHWIRDPVEGRFIKRLNRFACQVERDGRPEKVYLPNSGRLEELLLPGAKVILERRRESGKTTHDLLLVQTQRFPDHSPIWAVTDSRLPTLLLRWLLSTKTLDLVGDPLTMKNEPRRETGRFDLLVRTRTKCHLFETKSVNLVDLEGTARFPDAPTPRGVRHIQELSQLKTERLQPWVIFVVMRADAMAFSPFAERDADFSRALANALTAGVQVLALQFEAGPNISFNGRLELLMPPAPFPGFWPPSAVDPES
jgi:sugar fermentation stimulation protein A